VLLTVNIIESVIALGINLLHFNVSVCVCVCVCVCLSVQKVYCGKMADWIQVPFGVVSGFG